jgi:septal ring factor EnvC (AmiA/AmiB activator)
MYLIKNIPIILISILAIWNMQAYCAQPKEELKEIKKEIDIHKKKLEETRKVEKNLLDELQRLNQELHEIEQKIAKKREKVKTILVKISITEKEIKKYSYHLENRKQYLASRIKGIHRISYQPDPIFIILTEEDTTKALRIIRNSQKIINIDKKLIVQYKSELDKIAQQQTELKKLFISLKKEERELKEIEKFQVQKKKERESLLAKVQRDKATYERKIRELEENAKRLTRLLQETEKREKRTGKTETTQLEGEFIKRKGTLLWPVSGRVIAPYGAQKDPVFNIPMFRSGIYIHASPGTIVKASAEGKVVYANYFEGYENLVIINHGEGYYTVYGNLGKMSVKEGNFIKAGQVIGSVSEKSNIETTALYFEIRYRGKPLNPEIWLKK